MERRRFYQTMASEWQSAFVVSHKMPWCALLTAVKNYNKSLEKLQDFFFKTETKTKTKCSRRRLHDPRPRPRPRLSFLSSRCLETKTLVARITSPLFETQISAKITEPAKFLSLALYRNGNEKALRETQTLHAGCSKAEPEIFAPSQDGQNVISWRWSLPLPTNPVC